MPVTNCTSASFGARTGAAARAARRPSPQGRATVTGTGAVAGVTRTPRSPATRPRSRPSPTRAAHPTSDPRCADESLPFSRRRSASAMSSTSSSAPAVSSSTSVASRSSSPAMISGDNRISVASHRARASSAWSRRVAVCRSSNHRAIGSGVRQHDEQGVDRAVHYNLIQHVVHRHHVQPEHGDDRADVDRRRARAPRRRAPRWGSPAAAPCTGNRRAR